METFHNVIPLLVVYYVLINLFFFLFSFILFKLWEWFHWSICTRQDNFQRQKNHIQNSPSGSDSWCSGLCMDRGWLKPQIRNKMVTTSSIHVHLYLIIIANSLQRLFSQASRHWPHGAPFVYGGHALKLPLYQKQKTARVRLLMNPTSDECQNNEWSIIRHTLCSNGSRRSRCC